MQGEGWLGTGKGFSEPIEWFDGALFGDLNDGHVGVLGLCADPRAVAGPDFSIDDRRSNSAFGPVVFRLD